MNHTLYLDARLQECERAMNQPVFMPLDTAVGFFLDGLDLTYLEGHPPMNDPYFDE
jgi:hypothetical protein